MWKIVLITLLVGVCVSEARRGGNRRGGGGRGGRGARGRGVPPTAENVSMWNRTLVAEVAKEMGFTLPENAEQVYVVSGNKRQLKKENYIKSKTLYDFTGGSSKVLVKVKKWCFLLNKPEDLTREGVLQEVASFNGQTRAATTPVQMYVTELDAAQTTELQGRETVTTMCGSKPIRALSTSAPTAASTDATKTILVTTLDEQISITVPMNRRGRGRQGKRGNRRNGQN
ncbi:uncharacterized protein [Littorina saxatilis]|uniref:Uncharacterized protein n=1 Tax=Littorina saxatilis TaxID=31220 RepID=A0AAN9FVU2_9CAEN